jgi:hypothetical protein
MPTNPHVNGHACEIEIIRLRRTSQMHPTAWEAESSTGDRLHIAYRAGNLTASLQEPIATRPGAIVWQEILNFHPRRMEAELEWFGGGETGGQRDNQSRRELHSAAAAKDLAELRSGNWGKGFVLSLGQLRHWLELRSENLPYLMKAGLAGGTADVVIVAWEENG